jgi:hypothetical protein
MWAALFSAEADSQSSTPARSLCSITASIEHFKGTVITVRAEYISDGFENRALMDSSCPGEGLGVVFRHNMDEQSKEALRAALSGQEMGTLGKRVVGDFTGVLEIKQKRNLLIVERIRHLEVQQKQP